jgi:hypothetical protein
LNSDAALTVQRTASYAIQVEVLDQNPHRLEVVNRMWRLGLLEVVIGMVQLMMLED